ncbi:MULTISPECIES: isoprenylcysteine carboxylmethyltransferase family protein [Rhodanobacteraceae]|uniref:methyltransferase family protein n=1 Tax=Rhodanobacteraceae TaxID=1775411 RepID=UPI00088E022F|nr:MULTISPECIES: isoprenylcysteine carboxylmethyltransferase family protein [Rhodanobacteraceae]MDR6644260.1 protein-S-isoprenylcysteine O-methyltransferase Ste14 [Luteibacter sp. 1214]SDG30329.1 Protein-S-isoprenylcysteine O-methyltransferase Ste14 [Dyella sp. 333MFSha]SKB66765.1 Protein-S-isoprenylcysteine O-methyltransferase Ste14 [Luteibacter sp. 22Crub2.1]
MTTEEWLKHGISLAWWVLLAWWIWSAWGNKTATRGEPWLTRLTLYWLPLVVAFGLLGPGEWFGHTWLREAILPHTVPVFAVAFAFAVSGVALAIWSRVILGRNWSSVVQIKHDHELIETGPYRYIRHPIYTGILMAFIGSSIQAGDVRVILAVAILFASFWRKLRMEERMLGETFGDSYVAYKRRTKALIPGLL